MVAYVARRLLTAPLSLLLVCAVAFVVLRLTGNPVDIYLDINRTPEQVQALTTRLHLDQPLPIQFAIYVRDVLGGDFGQSLQFGGPAIEAVLARLGATAELLAVALLMAVLLGVSGGVACAVRRIVPWRVDMRAVVRGQANEFQREGLAADEIGGLEPVVAALEHQDRLCMGDVADVGLVAWRIRRNAILDSHCHRDVDEAWHRSSWSSVLQHQRLN